MSIFDCSQIPQKLSIVSAIFFILGTPHQSNLGPKPSYLTAKPARNSRSAVSLPLEVKFAIIRKYLPFFGETIVTALPMGCNFSRYSFAILARHFSTQHRPRLNSGASIPRNRQPMSRKTKGMFSKVKRTVSPSITLLIYPSRAVPPCSFDLFVMNLCLVEALLFSPPCRLSCSMISSVIKAKKNSAHSNTIFGAFNFPTQIQNLPPKTDEQNPRGRHQQHPQLTMRLLLQSRDGIFSGIVLDNIGVSEFAKEAKSRH